MTKTTVYLPDDLKAAVTRMARARGVSEAEVIREAIRAMAGDADPRRPLLPLFSSDALLAEQVDEALEGFGER